MSPELDLFPLNAVLLPGGEIRLHVFEDRYKEMIGGCIRDQRPFGAVLNRNRTEVGAALDPVSIGTSAIIREVRKLPHERLYIVARGSRRFEIQRLFYDKTYLRAAISYLPETAAPTDGDQRLRTAAEECFKGYLQALLSVPAAELENLALPRDPAVSSYAIADALQVDAMLKQQLLEAASVSQRLQAELELLNTETHRLRALRALGSAPDTRGKKIAFNVRFSAN